MREIIGQLLLTIGVLDALVVVLFTPQFAAILRDSVFNAMWRPESPVRLFDREVAFWQLIFGREMPRA